jgi:hypothetical protein
MSSFPGSPRLQKGAIVGLDPYNPVASVIIFQYNPETLTRTITPSVASPTRGQGGQADQGEALRLKGPPGETISFTIEVDATDQLEQAAPTATAFGVYPTLASLEMLLYPKSALVISNQVLSAAGIIEIIAPEAPLTVFVWGAKRVLPVRLSSLTITEEEFDPNLNPIRAKASVGLTVLSYQDLGLLSVGGALSMAQQVIKETMATINGAGAVGSALASVGR